MLSFCCGGVVVCLIVMVHFETVTRNHLHGTSVLPMHMSDKVSAKQHSVCNSVLHEMTSRLASLLAYICLRAQVILLFFVIMRLLTVAPVPAKVESVT